MSFVFVIKTANDCGHCRRFKSSGELAQLMSALQSRKYQVVHIDLPSMGSSIPREYPADLARVSGWFPSFIVVPKRSWDQRSVAGARVFPSNTSPTVANILAWA